MTAKKAPETIADIDLDTAQGAGMFDTPTRNHLKQQRQTEGSEGLILDDNLVIKVDGDID